MTDLEEYEPTEAELKDELEEEEELVFLKPPLKTLSIVSDDCILRENHIGFKVTYKGITGNLIRYAPGCEHQLMTLTSSEALEALQS